MWTDTTTKTTPQPAAKKYPFVAITKDDNGLYELRLFKGAMHRDASDAEAITEAGAVRKARRMLAKHVAAEKLASESKAYRREVRP